MKFLSIILVPLLFISCNLQAQRGKIKTYMSEDWDYWEFDLGDNSGKIKTYMSEDWDSWEYSCDEGSGSIKTYTSEDWDHWEVDGGNDSIKTY